MLINTLKLKKSKRKSMSKAKKKVANFLGKDEEGEREKDDCERNS